ncbi:unnamed protein product [Caenorhabditis nigoni]
MSNVSFVLDIRWSTFPSVFSPTNLTLQILDTTPQAIALCNNSSPYLVQAQSRVSALIIPPLSSSDLYKLRGVVFFDGPNWNRTYIGNAKQAWEKGRLLNSEGSFLTLMFLEPLDCSDANILLQEAENTDPVLQFKGVACSYEKHMSCQGDLETTSHSSAMMTYQSVYAPPGLNRLGSAYSAFFHFGYIPGSLILTQESGILTQESGTGTMEPGIRRPESGHENPEPGIRTQKSGIPNPESGIRNPDPGIWNPDPDIWNPDQKSGIRNPDPGTRNPETGIRNPDLFSGPLSGSPRREN